ncbi:hypothetical protein WA026_010257 [Henosepilachna vigintioctopunctata]|uniref:SIAH-type domain-containing protein n=1 Tax=Henosepilachna vigintioctopunctata TaxID=420089 RepID=A0AAW1UCJ8_9CUCU
MSSSEEKVGYDICVQSITENVYDILKCFECGEYCHPPFMQNTEGELVCPLCLKCDESGITVLTGTIFILESMYSLFEFPCKYNLQGCKFKGKGEKLVEHHKVCDYVSIMCPEIACRWQGRPKELFDHFSIHHPDFIEIYDSNQKEIYFATESQHASFDFYVILGFGKVFTVQLARIHRTGMLCYIATNVEPFNTADYECIIEVLLENGRTTRTILNLTQSDNTMREKIWEIPPHHLPFDFEGRNCRIILKKKLLMRSYYV